MTENTDFDVFYWNSSYNVMPTTFRGILICGIFRSRDMQEYICMFSFALEWR